MKAITQTKGRSRPPVSLISYIDAKYVGYAYDRYSGTPPYLKGRHQFNSFRLALHLPAVLKRVINTYFSTMSIT
eukprot:scaffold225620_cov59-Attheya_sp.AAC.2